MRRIILLGLFLFSFATSAQDAPEVISAANISRLQSVLQLDFWGDRFDTGMFWMNASASRIMWATDIGVPVTLRDLDVDTVAVADIAFNPPKTVLGYTFDEADKDAFFELIEWDGVISINNTEIAVPSMPLDFWMSSDYTLFVEIMSETGQLILLEYLIAATHYSLTVESTPTIHQVNFPPDDVVRIGRIPPPYTVTSSLEGIVKLWNLQTGETLYEVDNGTGLPSVFGAINTPPTHLVWRDNANETLFLLNFATGENRRIAELNGEYAQWYFLSPDASVILAVNLGFAPNIVAWDVATGEKTVLGEYRQCNRPQPDMARLSSDGTTLVIGCDTGLDIWRIIN